MADKNRFPTLESGGKKQTIGSLTSRLSLTSNILSTQSSLLSTASGLTPNLNNPFLGGSGLTNSLGLNTKSSLPLTQSNLLSPISTLARPSFKFESSVADKVTSIKPILTESSTLRTGLTVHQKLDKAPLIESSLTKLSLSQGEDTKKVIKTDEREAVVRGTTKDLESLTRKRHIVSADKVVKKNKNAFGKVTIQSIKQYSAEPPDYYIKYENEDEFMEVEFPKFIPPVKDLRLGVGRSLTDVTGIKRGLINCVSGSLISQPNFSNKQDLTRRQITDQVNIVINYDPEFVLKVALYSRKELNIRTTSNFLLALAANDDSCRIFLKKYFSAAVALPTDWIEVAEIFQTLENNLKLGALPAALRKAMIAKFPEFDKYQLAKYNKESSGKKKKAKAKEVQAKETHAEDASHRGQQRGRERSDVEDESLRGQQRGRERSDVEDESLRGKQRGKRTSDRRHRHMFDSDSSDDEGKVEGELVRQLSSISYDEKESEESIHKQKFTIKHLIRKLHLREPVEHVMCIIGKKYPLTPEEFYKSRLPGTWEEERAGKRMKLPVPETWETQVSLKGNKAQTWEDLIDHKKLPFMAMLRNLRNLIQAGISPKHHNIILKRLTDQKSVVNSKQFPFRFFSAYAVLDELKQKYQENQAEIIQTATEAAVEAEKGTSPSKRGRATQQQRYRIEQEIAKTRRNLVRGKRGKGRGGNQQFPFWIIKKMKKAAQEGIKEVPYDLNLLQRYQKALDTAVKIATVHNVQPIKGRTVLFCEMKESLNKACSSAKGLGKPRTIREIIVLMGLMCKYSCEECEMLLFDKNNVVSVDLEKGTILDNMERVLNVWTNVLWSRSRGRTAETGGVPYSVLLEKLRDRIEVDNLLIFGEGMNPDTVRGRIVCDWLRSYRHVVNPNLLFVSVAFSAPKAGFVMDIQPEHDNDIYISGYSDSILRFIAERGDAGQVNHVDKIDLAYQLRPMVGVKNPCTDVKKPILNPEPGLQLMAPTPSWRTVRVFISSTFKDMHGERDLLTRFVFPELRSLGRNRFIHIYEVDLRWGVTEEQTRDNRTVELCLEEVSRCQLFVGLLGDRYGWIPDKCQLPEGPEYAWVQQYPPGASVTELEMHLGALSKVNEAKDTAFFYFRDNSFTKDIPAVFENDFKSESEMHKTKIAALKKKLRSSGLEVFDGYPCHWGGCVDGKPMVAGLEEFGARVLNSLANAIKKLCPEQDEILSEDEHINNLQWAFITSCSADFIGRKTLISQIISKINSTNSGIIGLVGKPGSGKTAVMASTIIQHIKNKQSGGSVSVFVNMTGSAPGSSSLLATLRRLAHQINSRFGLGYSLPEDVKNLTLKFKDLLEEAANVCTYKLVIFLDGIDQMDSINEPFSLEWIPKPVPTNVVFVITANKGEKTHKSLMRLAAVEISVGELDMWDKADIVRQTLAKHRKSLDESGFGNQLKLLTLKRDAHNPLYLKLACEELRMFGVFEKISDKLKTLPHTTAQILQEILTRLEEEHGKDNVSLALCLLACARDGLYPEELFELLNWHKQLEGNEFQPTDLFNIDLKIQIPPLTFTILSRSIMCFLNPSSTWASLLYLANREICTAVRLRYMKGADASFEIRLHKLLAGFFLKQADENRNNTWQGKNARAFTELPYHLACSGSFHELERIVCNHQFIQSKCFLGLASTLMDDFNPAVITNNRAQEKELKHFLSQPRVQQFKSFVSRNLEILVNYPSLEWQQAMNEPSSSIPYIEAAAIRVANTKTPSYIEWSNKPETENQCYLTLSNFKMPVTSVTISPDSSKFAVGSQDLLVRLFDMAVGKELRLFSGHSDQVTDVCFVGNNILCSASADTSLSLWDVENGHRIHALKGHGRRVNSCASDLPGKLIASGAWDCSVIVWKAASGERLCELDVGSPVNSVDFHPSLEQVVVGSWDSCIRIYNYFHKTRIAKLTGHSASVRDIAYSFDGCHIASASLDGDIKIWAADKGFQVGTIKGHSGPINKLTFSPTGKMLITAGDDHQIKVWSGDLGIPLHTLHAENLGAATSVSVSPSGSTIAVGYHFGQVQIYDINSGVKLAKVKASESPVQVVTFSKDGAYIYAGCGGGYLQVLESNQGSLVCSLFGHTKAVLCVDTVNTYVVTGGEDCLCCFYEDIRKLKSSKVSAPNTINTDHTSPVSACCFNDAGTKLATASREASIRIYMLEQGFHVIRLEPLHVFHSCHADWINACRWSNTGDFLVTASNDFNLKVWDVESYTEKQTITGHTSAVNTVAYKYGCIVSGSSDGIVKVWSHKGTPITTLSGHTLRVNACDLYVKCKMKTKAIEVETRDDSWGGIVEAEIDAPQKRNDINIQDVLVASAADDGDVRIWKPLEANSLACLIGHSDRVLSVAADKNNHIASCSLDRTLRLWQPKLVEELTISKHDAPVTFICLARDNSMAITGSRDGVIKLWSWNETLMHVKHSFQAHEKSVNCGCFVGYGADKFVTGGDDNCLVIWEIVNRKKGFYVRKQSSFSSDMPVASVTISPEQGVIFFTTWLGTIVCTKSKSKLESANIVMNLNTGYEKFDSAGRESFDSAGHDSFDGAGFEMFDDPDHERIDRRKKIITCKDWPSVISMGENNELLVGTTDSSFFILGSSLVESNVEIQLTDVEKAVIATDDIDADIPKVKRPPNWVHSIVKSDGLILAGDSRGQIVIHGGALRTTLKIHRAAITAIEVVHGVIFTGSADSTIKVWKYLPTDKIQLTQIGQFFSPSPVTSLKATSATQNESIFLLAGDQLGNVHQLRWWP